MVQAYRLPNSHVLLEVEIKPDTLRNVGTMHGTMQRARASHDGRNYFTIVKHVTDTKWRII